jgi:hypothetical protein
MAATGQRFPKVTLDMTNPNRVHSIKTPIGVSHISSVAFNPRSVGSSSGQVWFGSDGGDIFVCPQPGVDTDILMCTYKCAKPCANFHVHGIFPIDVPACVLAHWLGGTGQAGPVDLIWPGGVRTRVVDEATLAQPSFRPRDPKVAVIIRERIRVLTFCGFGLRELFVHTAPNPIAAFSFGDDCFVYFAGAAYHLFVCSSQTVVRLNPAPINKPLVTTLSPTSFVLLYKEFVLVAGQGDEKGHILKTDAAHRLPSKFLSGKDAVYLFYDVHQIKLHRSDLIDRPSSGDPLLKISMLEFCKSWNMSHHLRFERAVSSSKFLRRLCISI